VDVVFGKRSDGVATGLGAVGASRSSAQRPSAVWVSLISTGQHVLGSTSTVSPLWSPSFAAFLKDDESGRNSHCDVPSFSSSDSTVHRVIC